MLLGERRGECCWVGGAVGVVRCDLRYAFAVGEAARVDVGNGNSRTRALRISIPPAHCTGAPHNHPRRSDLFPLGRGSGVRSMVCSSPLFFRTAEPSRVEEGCAAKAPRRHVSPEASITSRLTARRRPAVKMTNRLESSTSQSPQLTSKLPLISVAETQELSSKSQ